MYQNLFILAFFAFLYGMVSKKAEATLFSGPLVFVAFGLLAGPFGLGFLQIEADGEQISFLAEVTLAIILFSDASRVSLRTLRQSIQIPKRLLLIGLPLTILIGLLVGLLFFPAVVWVEVAIIAVILAPTDAALGKPIVDNKKVPEKVRISLDTESGLNDGLCVPLMLICFTLLSNDFTISSLSYFVKSIGIGAVVGCGLVLLTSTPLTKAVANGWVPSSWYRVLAILLALAIYSLADVLGGSGFIGCFLGGLLFGSKVKTNRNELISTAEGAGALLSLVTWVVFGAVFVSKAFAGFDVRIVGYAVLSLTVIRIVPVFIALMGSGIPARMRIFMGWFGPRGLASIVFAVMALNQNVQDANTLALTVITTILLSVVLHGITANPYINLLFGERSLRKV